MIGCFNGGPHDGCQREFDYPEPPVELYVTVYANGGERWRPWPLEFKVQRARQYRYALAGKRWIDGEPTADQFLYHYGGEVR